MESMSPRDSRVMKVRRLTHAMVQPARSQPALDNLYRAETPTESAVFRVPCPEG